MNHKPYEDLIFSSDALTSTERAALQGHLDFCEDCRSLFHAWEHVVMEIHAAPIVEPILGFSKRWQHRLEADIARQKRRQSLLILAFSILGAGLLFGALALLALPLTGSPLAFVIAWISRGWMLLSTVTVLQDMLAVIFKALVNSVSPLWLVLLLGICSLMAVLWATSLRMLMLPRRVTK